MLHSIQLRSRPWKVTLWRCGLAGLLVVLVMPAPGWGQAPAALDRAAIKATLTKSRLQLVDEEDLRQRLEDAPELTLGPERVKTLLRGFPIAAELTPGKSSTVNFDPKLLVQVYPEAAHLPLRSGAACRLSAEAAMTLQQLSRKLRMHVELNAPKLDGKERLDPGMLEMALRKDKRGAKPEWLRSEAIPTLMQMLMHEDRPLRRLLVELLDEVPGKAATVALAQRAVFDLAPDVREAALEALADRRYADFRPVLLEALRHPWPRAAEHAAEALVALRDQEAVLTLVTLLEEPDPCAPSGTKGSKLRMREVVKTNHVNNCLLCHAPALSYGDPVPGVIPGISWQIKLPKAQAAALTGNVTGPGSHNYSRAGSGGTQTMTIGFVPTAKGPSPVKVRMTTVFLPIVVRADITYLRQDFSVVQPVTVAGLFKPVDMRFDYLVRTRPASQDEVDWYKKKDKEDYPQRDAVLYALRALTGKDPGTRTADWQALFPHARRDLEAARLKDVLLQAGHDQRRALIKQFKTARSPAHRMALAWALPHLGATEKPEARAALQTHVARLPLNELHTCLQGGDPEIRRAAMAIAGEKMARQFIPDLIQCMADSDRAVAHAAHTALIRITAENFGPPLGGAPEAYAEAALRWSQWWNDMEGK